MLSTNDYDDMPCKHAIRVSGRIKPRSNGMHDCVLRLMWFGKTIINY